MTICEQVIWRIGETFHLWPMKIRLNGRITANTKIKSAWRVRCSVELADVCTVKSKSVKRSLPIDIGRSDFIEITKSYQTDNTKGKFPLTFRSVQFWFRRIFKYLQTEKCWNCLRYCIFFFFFFSYTLSPTWGSVAMIPIWDHSIWLEL